MGQRTAAPAHVPADRVSGFELEFRGPVEELYPRLAALRGEGRAIWLTDGLGSGGGFGAWCFTQPEDIRAALLQPDLFSSQLGGAGAMAPMIPIFMDPPEHSQYRRLLNPLFAPSVVARMEQDVTARMEALVDSVAPQGSCNFVSEVAVEFPTRVFTAWMGLPEADTGRFVGLVSTLIHGADQAERGAAMGGMFGVLDQLVTERLESPGQDLMSDIVRLDLDGRPLSRDELFRIAFLLMIAGLDTVVAALSFSFWHLAQTPEHRAALATGQVGTASVVEDLLRRHSFVHLPRIVTRDAEFAGVKLRQGDPVVLSMPLASWGPDESADLEAVDLGHGAGSHVAFGLGPHRCIGAHLARLEMRVALDVWHRRIPDYELGGEATGYAGAVMGLTSLPLRWA